MVESPLFSNYLLARSSPQAWTKLLGIPGVLSIVKQGGSSAWIRDEHVVDLQRTVETVTTSDEGPQVEHEFGAGDLVRVIDGPMAGVVGTIREVRGGRRVLVGIERIGRALSVSKGVASVAPVHEVSNLPEQYDRHYRSFGLACSFP